MRQVVTVNVGDGAIRAAQKTFQLYSLEHGLDPDGVRQPGTAQLPQTIMFDSNLQGLYIPHCLYLNSTHPGELWGAHLPHQVVSGGEKAMTYAGGRYGVGRRILQEIMDSVRIQVERCLNLQGFMVCGMVSGGTGSGISGLLLQHLAEAYPKKIRSGVHVLPSLADPDCQEVQPYNTILSLHDILQLEELSIIMDNTALEKTCAMNLDIQTPSHHDLNHVIAQHMSYITSGLRYELALNTSLQEMLSIHVPYPQFHLLSSHLAPLASPQKAYQRPSLVETTCQAFDINNTALSMDARAGQFISCSLNFRGGNIVPKHVGPCIMDLKTSREMRYVQWCPTGFRCGLHYHPPLVLPESRMRPMEHAVHALSNHTEIGSALQLFSHSFDNLYHRRAQFQRYLTAGMQEGQLREAREGITALLIEYEEAIKESSWEEDEE